MPKDEPDGRRADGAREGGHDDTDIARPNETPSGLSKVHRT
jgi:hypothetical protein